MCHLGRGQHQDAESFLSAHRVSCSSVAVGPDRWVGHLVIPTLFIFGQSCHSVRAGRFSWLLGSKCGEQERDLRFLQGNTWRAANGDIG